MSSQVSHEHSGEEERVVSPLQPKGLSSQIRRPSHFKNEFRVMGRDKDKANLLMLKLIKM